MKSYDYSALSAEVKASSDKEIQHQFPFFEAALKSAVRRKLVEKDSAEYAGELAADGPPSAGALRDFLQDTFEDARDAAAKLKPSPAPTGGNGEVRGWLQWVILWASVLTAAHVWLGLDLRDFWSQYEYGGRWGLDGYLYPALGSHRSELAFVTLVIGGLLLWQISARHSEIGTPIRSLGLLSTRVLIVACLVVLLVLLALQFRTAPRSRGFGRFGSLNSAAGALAWRRN